MKLRTLLAVYLVLSQSACAVYTVTSMTSFITTDKSLSDHTLSVVTQADCNVTNVVKDKYYCEQRDIAVTYNRNGF